MQRYVVVLAALCAVVAALAAGPASAGNPLPSPAGGVEQTVGNETNQSNEAGALNVPILSGNSVAGANGGDQTSSAGTTQDQTNLNATGQDASQTAGGAPAGTSQAYGTSCGCSEQPSSGQEQTVSNETKQRNEAVAVNVPIASGNSVALVNTGDQTSSAGTSQEQTNANATSQDADQAKGAYVKGGSYGSGGQEQTVSNETKQRNEAVAINVPIASGNSVALVNTGDQTSSAGTDQQQKNVNVTRQDADQSGSGPSSDGRYARDPKGKGEQEQTVSNETKQRNEAVAINVPIASGNSVAVFNEGNQSSSAGTSQEQTNLNGTHQSADQSGSAGKGEQEQTVSNETKQRNDAVAVNVPIASGNSVALVNGGASCGCEYSTGGSQTSSAGVDQQQTNVNVTKQHAEQSGGGSYTKKGHGEQEQTVSNETYQRNEAVAVNVPIASGNSVALVNTGDQTSSAGTDQQQTNVNVTNQHAEQSGPQGEDGSYGNDPCPKPEPKPCKPKPCKPKPKPCKPKCEPKPCPPKPCPPKPCESGGPVGVLTNAI